MAFCPNREGLNPVMNSAFWCIIAFNLFSLGVGLFLENVLLNFLLLSCFLSSSFKSNIVNSSNVTHP